MKKKLAILGASYLQRPLIEKAKEIGIETHVFAWRDDCVILDIADFFYPISVIEREPILQKCKEIDIHGVTSIGSDIAMPTVNYIAEKMGLVGNTLEATIVTTDKLYMREALTKAGIPCPYFELYLKPTFKDIKRFKFPVIIKPTDRSGSKGVTKVEKPKDVNVAIKRALANSINGRAIVEEFIEGREFSVEMISYKGDHYYLATTDKVTTGAPYFVEIEHHQPADISYTVEKRIIQVVKKALDVLHISNSASHSEILITNDGSIRIIEIAGRMGGDFIGSDLVELSTGYNFLKGVIYLSLGVFTIPQKRIDKFSGVYFLSKEREYLKTIIETSCDSNIVKAEINNLNIRNLQSSDDRSGFIIYKSNKKIVFNNSIH